MPQLLECEQGLCYHSRAAPADVKMRVSGRSRFTSAFYHTWRYSEMLRRSSHPTEIRLDRLPFEIFFPMLRICLWSYVLRIERLPGFLDLLKPSTCNDSDNENKDHTSHPWLLACRTVFRARARMHFPVNTSSTCWFDFFEGCQVDWEGKGSPQFNFHFLNTILKYP